MDQNNNIKYTPPVPPFLRYCSAIIPTAFDDSLSYYEALCALYKWLQDNITGVINNNAAVTQYYIDLVKELKSYVENYFANLDVQEEINNKLDQMAEDGTLGRIVADYVATKVDYFYIDSDTSEVDVLSYFATDKAKVIEFATGTYEYINPIILTSNTTVYLNNATLTSQSGIGMFGYSLDSTDTGYTGVHDVTICNGTIGFSIALMHNANLVFENINFLGTLATHALQIGACKDITIKGCTFNGLMIDDTKAETSEMIQLEVADRTAQPYLNDEDSPAYDHVGNDGVYIINNTFNDGDNVNSRFYIAIGNHSSYSLGEYYNKNIFIKDNYFGNAHYSQVNPACFDNCVIENNTFEQTNEYANNVNNIYFKFFNKNVQIKSNKFIGGSYNISSFGISNNYYNENVLIEDNEFTTEFDYQYASNIILKNFKKVIIRNNTFGKARYKNVWLANTTSGGVTYQSSDVTIDNNTFITGNILADSKSCLHVRYGSNIKIVNNIVTLSSESDNFAYILGADVDGYLVSGNKEITGFLTRRLVGGTNLNYTNIYDAYQQIVSNNTNYAAKTDESITTPLNRFNRLCLVLHKSGDATIMYTTVIKEYAPLQKFQIGRKYPLTFADESGNTITALFSLDITNNTYSYSSPNNLTLRSIYGYNE